MGKGRVAGSAWALLYLIVSVDAISISTTVSQISELQNATRNVPLADSPIGEIAQRLLAHVLRGDKAGGSAIASALKNLNVSNFMFDLEALGGTGISRQEFVDYGMGAEADFDDVVGTNENGTPKQAMTFSQFQAYSNRVGKTPASISIHEYPILIRRICESPNMLNLCVTLGPYHIAQGVAVLIFLVLGAILVFSSQLSTWVASDASRNIDEWRQRLGVPLSEGDLDAAIAQRTFSVVGVGVGLIVIFEILNQIGAGQKTTSQLIANRRTVAQDARHALDDEFVKLDPEGHVRDKQDADLATRLGLSTLASSYVDEQEQRRSPSSDPNVNNPKDQSSRTASTSVLWGVLIALILGISSGRGAFSVRTWTDGQLGKAGGVIPLVIMLLVFLVGFACQNNQPVCVEFKKRSATLAFGLLAIIGTIVPLVRTFTKIKTPVYYDPVSGLGLPEKFDFDPTVKVSTVARTHVLFWVWVVALLFGMGLSGDSAGKGLASFVSRIVSDGAQLFTLSLAMILHLYLFWHNPMRYSSVRAVEPNLLNTDLPGWADAYISDLLVFLLDIFAIYPILYDYLTWRHTSRTGLLHNIDLAICVTVGLAIFARMKAINNQNSDTKAQGKQYNQATLAISGLVTLILLMVFMARQGRVTLTTGLIALLFFGMCVGLYWMVDLSTYGGKSGDSPIADGHFISDLNMLDGITMMIILLQRIVKMTEPDWIYPAGASMKGGIGLFNVMPLVAGYLMTLLGFGWTRVDGHRSPSLAALRAAIEKDLSAPAQKPEVV